MPAHMGPIAEWRASVTATARLAAPNVLHDDTPFFSGDPSNWKVWFDHASPGAIDGCEHLHFSHATLALDAAIDALGVALNPTPLALLDVSAGRLVVPFGPMIKSESGYYLLTPTGNIERPQVTLFRGWILDEVRKDDARLAGLLNAKK